MFARYKKTVLLLSSMSAGVFAGDQEFSILLMGPSGAGKSTFASAVSNYAQDRDYLPHYKFLTTTNKGKSTQVPKNSSALENQYRFEKQKHGSVQRTRSLYAGQSDTHEINSYTINNAVKGLRGKIKIIDTLGLDDTDGGHVAKDSINVLEAYLDDHPDELDMIVMVVKSDMNRASETCIEMLRRLKELFPPEVAEKVFVVVNFSHRFQSLNEDMYGLMHDNFSRHIRKADFHNIDLVYLARYNDYSSYMPGKLSWTHFDAEKNFSEAAIGKLFNKIKQQDFKLIRRGYSVYNTLRFTLVGHLKTGSDAYSQEKITSEDLERQQHLKEAKQALLEGINLYARVNRRVDVYQDVEVGHEDIEEKQIFMKEITVQEPYVTQSTSTGEGLSLGGFFGAVLGTIICPGAGTAIGASLGGASGGIAASNSDTVRYRTVTKMVPVEETVITKKPIIERQRVGSRWETVSEPIPGARERYSRHKAELDVLCQTVRDLTWKKSNFNQTLKEAIQATQPSIQRLQNNAYGQIYKGQTTKLRDMLLEAFIQRYPNEYQHTPSKQEAVRAVLNKMLGLNT